MATAFMLHNSKDSGNPTVVARFLLGPAGSGKTFRCLTEIRTALQDQPDGPPLVLLAPKQSTYQLERALLSELPGYTRLHVVSFERLAAAVFDLLDVPLPKIISDEARLMVLRSILSRRKRDLQLFRASARLTGFADQLAMALDELQRHEVTPAMLEEISQRLSGKALSLKLRDLSTLFHEYANWLDEHKLRDANSLLSCASELLNGRSSGDPLLFDALWADGFADLSIQETAFLAAVANHCGRVTATFCLESIPNANGSWLSTWAAPARSLERCQRAFINGGSPVPLIERLHRTEHTARFANPVLAHIEEHWAAPSPYGAAVPISDHLRLACCPDPETEVTEAAREITKFVRAGGRFRQVAVLARQLDPYYGYIKRIFAQFEIPCFSDRREDVSHHPLAELTRSALRTVAFDWNPQDWFAALKTGLVPATEEEIDQLENEALARGWRGEVWRKNLSNVETVPEWVAQLVARLMPPFKRFHAVLKKNPKGVSGPELASAIKSLWEVLRVEHQLASWAETMLDGSVSGESHFTVWTQINAWLADLELAFSRERLALREWLPILEAGLGKLSVGIIPPALDQVLAGTIDRSRNCEASLVIVLGLNEALFPAGKPQSALLTDHDRIALGQVGMPSAGTAKDQLARERHLAYLAFTRASRRLVVMFSANNSQGEVQNPSLFVSHLKQLFPDLRIEDVPASREWHEAEHSRELILPALKALNGSSPATLPDSVLRLEPVSVVIEKCGTLAQAESENLGRELAAKLYGPVLKSSVSRMEQFAECPFRFFVNSGLDAKERTGFELDARERGSFQHAVLAEFHNRLSSDGRRWRDLTPAAARGLLAEICSEIANKYRDGLLQTSEQTQLTALLITESLQDFIQTMVEWMRSQYLFDPAAAELGFGPEGECPAWQLDLDKGHTLQLEGRIDRVDLHKSASGEALCVVTDYKSGLKKLDDVLVEHGIQLQLLSYLNVLAHWPDPAGVLGARKLLPAGVFYVSLKTTAGPGCKSRNEALDGAMDARKAAYKHTGRYDSDILRLLDSRDDARSGDQFAYKINANGSLAANCKEAMDTPKFQALLAIVERNLKSMGARIFAGEASVDPYRKGSQTACDRCDYLAICRSDPWTRVFRVLKKEEVEKP